MEIYDGDIEPVALQRPESHRAILSFDQLARMASERCGHEKAARRVVVGDQYRGGRPRYRLALRRPVCAELSPKSRVHMPSYAGRINSLNNGECDNRIGVASGHLRCSCPALVPYGPNLPC